MDRMTPTRTNRLQRIVSAGKGWWLSLLIALSFAGWGLRTVGANNIVDTDGARHAMNGAFIHDVIIRGRVLDIYRFAKLYYAHFPALSMPYHPPLFPAIEALFFLLFGVNVLVARLAIAVAVAISALVLFRIVVATHGSPLMAAASTITFLCLPYPLTLSSDVMLEFPALVFTLLAIHCLVSAGKEFPMRRALAFAVLAGAAVWTKQQTVFLGALPFFYFALMGRWRLFRKSGVWLSAAVFAGLVVALSALSMPVHGAGVNQAAPPHRMQAFLHNVSYYTTNFPSVTGPAGLVLGACLILALLRRSLRVERVGIYVSWAVTAMLVLLAIGPYTTRYLFFVLPPVIVLGYASLFSVAEQFQIRRSWTVAAALILTLIALPWGYRAHRIFLLGPDVVAHTLAERSPSRILYCGGTDGSFMFSYRSSRAGLDTTIIPGDKLPRQVFTPAGIEAFAHRYGIQYIVLEHATGLRERARHPWEALIEKASPSMVHERAVKLASSDGRWNGALHIYHFTDPSPHPEDVLTMKMNMIGGSMAFDLKQ
jgi:hypothetical protein